MNIKNTEDNKRLAILNSILRCPHRDLDQIIKVHEDAQKADPLFYAKLAIWHKYKGEIRDHNEVFTGMLCLDEFPEHRETGLALLRTLPSYMKERIKGLIKGKKVKIRHKLDSTFRSKKGKQINKVRIEEKTVGLKKNLPRSFKSEIKAYLKWLEADHKRFDNAVLHDLNSIQGMYASLRIKPSDRAKEIIFDKKIPPNSKLAVIKKILVAETPLEKAELIVENKIPYTTAVGLIKHMTPSILASLIQVMTPQEVINNIASLKERGAYDNPEVKRMVIDKLKKAENKKGVASLKSKVAKQAAKTGDEEINAQLDKVADEGIKKTAQISLPTAIIIDKSASMNTAIEVGKQLASMISGATISDLWVITADSMAREIKANGDTLSAWEVAFKTIRANGGTSLGAGIDFMIRKGYCAEQIVIITDEGENQAPYIHTALAEYKKTFNIQPTVIDLYVNGDGFYNDATWERNFRNNLKKEVPDFTRLEIDGNSNNYYGLPSLIPLLAQKSQLDLLYEIMDIELLERKPFEVTKKRKARTTKAKTKKTTIVS